MVPLKNFTTAIQKKTNKKATPFLIPKHLFTRRQNSALILGISML